MAVPTTVDDFVRVLHKSGLIEPERLDAFVQQATAAGEPVPSKRLAGQLIQAGLLTQFQAEQTLQGKWRGFTIGKYRVLERLGSGGMGTVYLCEHQSVRRKVAVKVLPTSQAANPSALGRFYREARASGALDHPNLVKAHDIDEENGLHFLVMDYVEGSSLQAIVSRFGPLAIPRAAHYIRQAAEGLQHAHEAGLIHRDVKPANILLDRTGTVKVLDLGLARFFHDESDPLTLKYDDKNVLGTADYVAPEQALNSHEVDIRADIYALGATFYFCLTGQVLFPEGKVTQKLMWHQIRQPTPVRKLRSDVPEAMAEIVARMLAKDPAQRYQTPQEVADALAPWTETPIPLPPEVEMPRLSPAARSVMAGADAGSSTPRRLGRPAGTAASGRCRTLMAPRPAPEAGQETPCPATTKADTERDRTRIPVPGDPAPAVVRPSEVLAARTVAPRWRGKRMLLIAVLTAGSLIGLGLRLALASLN